MKKQDLYIAGNFTVTHHNWSISIFFNGSLYAFELERFFRVKEFPGEYLFGKFQEKGKSLENVFKKKIYTILLQILEKNGISKDDLNQIWIINFPNNFPQIFEGIRQTFISNNDHHYLHACCSYFSSGFKESTILCVDFSGYDMTLGKEIMHSIWYGKDNTLKLLDYDEFNADENKIGIGAAYRIHSAIIGKSEGTIMGLSSYGKRKLLDPLFDEKGNILKDFFYSSEKKVGEKEVCENIRNNLINVYAIEGKQFSKSNFDDFGNIAYTIQKNTEEAMLSLSKRAFELGKTENIALGGGVGLNILGNSNIQLHSGFKNVYIPFSTNDAGLSLGGLFYLYYICRQNTEKIDITSASLGHSYSNDEVLYYLEEYKEFINITDISNDKYDFVSKKINEGKIVGWFQGRSEFGPRSLGFRSILASPFLIENLRKVNDIKKREGFRPLAPVVMEEFFQTYFDFPKKSSYMTFSANVKEEQKNKIPAVVHIDGTARFQTVNELENCELYKLLQSFNNLTGVPILINTSFNQHDEPIVESPKNSIGMLFATELNGLVLNDFYIEKKNNSVNSNFVYNKEKIYKELMQDIVNNQKI